MPRLGDRKCVGCGEWVSEIDRDQEGSYWSRHGRFFCAACYQNGEYYTSKLVHYAPDGTVEATTFDEDFIYLVSAGEAGDLDIADWQEDDPLPEPLAGMTYHRTDAWRGHWGFTFAEGYENVAQGWVTGWPDETVPRKYDIAELYELFREGKLRPPVDLWWVFAPTSNVFSTSCDIVVRAKDKDALDDWLVTLAHTDLADLERMLR